uniref:NADH-ubiquinone oxidoreductase chain 2 n=1 Tax=Phryganogryllacris superangulata TaxID=2016114 RepID=A0A9E8Z932_9ORTH|nr:NADH dehydrogenase subunit 2 [Phryganogryllacris superangulata]WAL05826.1 NADH dehydrogenase subunit 2 [Phryganogryllacris superangulata]
MINTTQLLFLITLSSGTLITMSATSWFSAWMGLEINLLSFIPLMTNSKNPRTTEATLKYFLIQALASIIFLFTTTLIQLHNTLPILTSYPLNLLIISTLLMKMGAAPFHFWFPETMEGLDWFNCLIIMTWQKIAPLILLSYLMKMNLFISMTIIASVMIGSLGGLNQTSLRKLLAYSSINHLGWMIAAMSCMNNSWELYFMIYSFLSLLLTTMFSTFNIFHINQNFLTLNNSQSFKMILFINLLSLGGLPPFLGFLPKWITIQILITNNHLFMCTIMVTMSLITLFYYIRLTFSSLLINAPLMQWISMSTNNNLIMTTLTIMTSLSILGLSLSMITFNIL